MIAAAATSTPGPWKVWTGPTDASVNIVNDHGEYVCLVGREQRGADDAERIRADARLIAAAPDLLAALAIVDVAQIIDGIEHFIMDGDVDVDAIWQPYVDKLTALRDAIAKAEGAR